MNPDTIVEGIVILVIGSVLGYVIKRLLRRHEELGADVKRRRRRPSLGRAYGCAGAGSEVEDVSASGALLRTKGICHLRDHQRFDLDLDLRLAGGSAASVKAVVVRSQWPSWRRGLVGAVGAAFRFNGGEDPSRSVVEAFVADGPRWGTVGGPRLDSEKGEYAPYEA
jgi:hypothetical protein